MCTHSPGPQCKEAGLPGLGALVGLWGYLAGPQAVLADLGWFGGIWGGGGGEGWRVYRGGWWVHGGVGRLGVEITWSGLEGSMEDCSLGAGASSCAFPALELHSKYV